jgi:hypothetical protein
MYILILLLILFIIIFIYIKPNISEYYDARAVNIKSIEDCADIASSIYGVAGFAYNPKTNNCFTSRIPISYPVLEHFPYQRLSKQNDIICNKRLPIINQKDIANNTIIENRTYECNHNDKYSKNRNLKTTYYFEKNKPIKEITLQRNNVLPITYHNIFCIDWPTRPSELNDLHIEFSQRNTHRQNFGEKIIFFGPADNLFIEWNKAS